MTRRMFLRDSGLVMAGIGAAPLWLERVAAAGSTVRRKILVTIFQRGAADGLNIVVPFGERSYYEARPGIGVPAPSKRAEAGKVALDLDGFFALHPALAPLQPLYAARQLAVVHAAGSPDPTRSHFDAQDYMESGTPGVKSAGGGWLNRSLEPEAHASPIRALALGPSLPRVLRGRNSAVAVNRLEDFRLRDSDARSAFETMYLEAADAKMRSAGSAAFDSMSFVEALTRKPYAPANGAEYPRGGFGERMRQIAQLIKADSGLEVAFTDVGGWDHHVIEAGRDGTEGRLAGRLAEFGATLAAFCRDLGDRMDDVVVVTMSEFGRTVRENGTRGTDHGHANVMFVLGGAVRGGKVYGEWPGLGREQLYEGRDLRVTTDFRDVLGELVAIHRSNADLDSVFPGYKTGRERFRGVLA